MSNLTNNTNSLQAILETINSLPEAGSGSGGGGAAFKTCSVRIECVYRPDNEDILLTSFYYNSVNDDNALEPGGSLIMLETNTSETIDNVLCGSILIIGDAGYALNVDATELCELVNIESGFMVIQMPDMPGSVSTIQLSATYA